MCFIPAGTSPFQPGPVSRKLAAAPPMVRALGDSKADPAMDVPKLAAWTMLANELLNLDEVLNTLDETTITVRVAGHQPDRARQVLAVALVDLLGRVFPRIDVQCSRAATTAPGLPPGPTSLTELLEEARGGGAGPCLHHRQMHPLVDALRILRRQRRSVECDVAENGR